MSPKSFTELDVYKECRKFRLSISDIVKNHFPNDEKYKLADQIIRSSRSITANIAEENGRFYYLDNVRFCRIARGSLEETLEHLITAYDEKYITLEKLKIEQAKHQKCMQLLNGYIRYLKNSKKGAL